MNFDAIDKLSAECVTDLLNEIPGAGATRLFLILTRCVLDSFLSKELPVEKRIYKIWYSTIFCRIWRYWLLNNGGKLQENFITLNTYTCIELNAHGIILILEKLRERSRTENMPQLQTWLYSSQACEIFFRETRAMSSMFSTVVNYTMLDMLRRLKRIQTMNEITNDLGMYFLMYFILTFLLPR